MGQKTNAHDTASFLKDAVLKEMGWGSSVDKKPCFKDQGPIFYCMSNTCQVYQNESLIHKILFLKALALQKEI